MIIIEDSRQKPDKNKHIRDQLEELGCKVIRSKMLVGDYQIANKGDIVIDTKYGLGEVESNLFHDHERFRNECILARDAGIKLIVLVQEPKVSSVSEVFSWYNPALRYRKTAANGRKLGKTMLSMTNKYGVIWEFATKKTVGNRIVELLGGEVKSDIPIQV